MDKKKAGCGTYLTGFIVWMAATAIVGVVLTKNSEIGQPILALVSEGIGLLAVFIFIAIKKGSVGIKAFMEKRGQREEDRANRISRYYGILHADGLDVPENCKAACILSPGTFTVVCGAREFILMMNRFKRVEFRQDVDEMKYRNSRLKRGIDEASMSGEISAVLGPAPTKKRKRDVIGYAIIFYEDSQGELQSFLLKDEAVNTFACAKLVDALKPRTPEQTRGGIEL